MQWFKRLRASRLDNSTEAEMRRLAQVRLLIIDDFALQPLDAAATADFYELVVARHLRHIQSRTRRMAHRHDRRDARRIRHRPADLHRSRTHRRRTVLPTTPKA